MASIKPPIATEFFACASGVCVYVQVDGHQVRVEFQSIEGPVIARGASAADVARATAVASVALERHHDELLPLFASVAERPFHQ